MVGKMVGFLVEVERFGWGYPLTRQNLGKEVGVGVYSLNSRWYLYIYLVVRINQLAVIP